PHSYAPSLPLRTSVSGWLRRAIRPFNETFAISDAWKVTGPLAKLTLRNNSGFEEQSAELRDGPKPTVIQADRCFRQGFGRGSASGFLARVVAYGGGAHRGVLRRGIACRGGRHSPGTAFSATILPLAEY